MREKLSTVGTIIGALAVCVVVGLWIGALLDSGPPAPDRAELPTDEPGQVRQNRQSRQPPINCIIVLTDGSTISGWAKRRDITAAWVFMQPADGRWMPKDGPLAA